MNNIDEKTWKTEVDMRGCRCASTFSRVIHRVCLEVF